MPESTDRSATLAPVRQPLQARMGSNASDAQNVSTFTNMSTRAYNREIQTYDVIPQQSAGVAPNPVVQNTGQFAEYGQADLTVNSGVSLSGQTQPLYDITNPLGLTADLFSRFFSSAPVESPQSPVVVGDTSLSQSKSGNAGLFLVLILLGIGGYFIYRRYKNG